MRVSHLQCVRVESTGVYVCVCVCYWFTIESSPSFSLLKAQHILSCNVIGIYYMPLLPVSVTSVYIYIDICLHYIQAPTAYEEAKSSRTWGKPLLI